MKHVIVKKSEVMVFEVRNKHNVPSVYLNNVPLKRMQSFRYLGDMLTFNLRDDVDIEKERRAVRVNMFAHRIARCSREVKITLFRKYCTTFYA